MRKLPDYVIIGAPRCGTTSLYNYLAQHPFVAPAFRKEVHFFDLNYNKGLSWYRANFPTVLSARLFEQKHGRPLLTGEASPYYLFHPHAPRRIRQHLPGAKLIVLLRNPIERAYSHYNLARKLGLEDLSFEEGLKKESERLEGEVSKMLRDEFYLSKSHRHHSYLQKGIYADQLKTWFDLFPREQILILKSEDLFSDPSTTFRQVLDFLHLPPWEPPEYEKYNALEYQKIDPSTRKWLAEYFQDHNRRLYDLLGRDFGWR